MRAKLVATLVAACAVAAILLTLHNQPKAAVGNLPTGHGIKCLKADGQSPCGNTEISNLSDDILGIKKLGQVAKTIASDTKGAINDGKQAASDAKQVGDDGKQLASDSKQLGADAKNKNLQQGVSDAQQAGSDASSTVGDAKTAGGDVKQVAGDVDPATADLRGIGAISLKSADGSMTCAQNDGSVCSDDQTKALKAHAAQMSPPINIQREVDVAAN
jgi:hypothetical protein